MMSAFSDGLALPTLATPTALAATAYSSTKVELNFTNNSVGEDYHCIERDTVEIAQVASGTTYYLDSGLTPGTEYSYRVRDISGETYSDYCTPDTVTPPTNFAYIAYGTGVTAEGVALTALATEVARHAAVVSLSSTSTANDTVVYAYGFTSAAIQTITEVGVFDDPTAGTMLGRKLLSSTVPVVVGEYFLASYQTQITDGGCGN